MDDACLLAPKTTKYHYNAFNQLVKFGVDLACAANDLDCDGVVGGTGAGARGRCQRLAERYDPCLSCATHAVGTMPLVIALVDAEGRVLGEIAR